MKLSRTLLSITVFVVLSVPAMAATRVFVSGSGMDVSTCPITAPCRSFSYAITQVASGGEIIALDTAGYGPVSIAQPVSIVAAPGATAFVAASSGVAITVAAGASDVVTLRGLALTSTGAPTGIQFGGGYTLNVENCVINGFTSEGIVFTRSLDNGGPELRVLNTMVRNNQVGIFMADTGAGSPAGGPPPNLGYATIANSQIFGSATYGLLAADNSRVAVSNTVIAGNGVGVQAIAGDDFSFSDVNLDRCTISHNGTGVYGGDLAASQNVHGIIRLANCMITGNATGITATLDGQTLSRIPAVSVMEFTNTIAGNTVLDGSPTGTYTAR